MDCPNCSTPHSAAARFCAYCGDPLHRGVDRAQHFAALPDEPVSAPHLLSTLMPHLVSRRLHVYRDALALALLAALIASAFGMLSVALLLAAVALPTAVLVYFHDHDLWRGEFPAVVGVATLVALALGVGVGALQRCFASATVLSAAASRLAPVKTILELGVLLPIVTFVALLIAPLIVTARPAFRRPIDAVVLCTLSGAALSLGLSVVVELGAFTQVTYGGPTEVAFIALTLGFLQPIIFGTAAAVSVMPLRGGSASAPVGVIKGVLLVVLYGLGTTLLTPLAAHGIVLITGLAVLLAAVGLVATRADLHAALLTGARTAAEVCDTGDSPAPSDAEQEATVSTTATRPARHTPPPVSFPGVDHPAGHRLSARAVIIVVALVVVLVAAIGIGLALTRNPVSPRQSVPDPIVVVGPPAHGARVATAPALLPARTAAATPMSGSASSTAITLGPGITLTPAAGWQIDRPGDNVAELHSPDGNAVLDVTVGTGDAKDAAAELNNDVQQLPQNSDLSNVKTAKCSTSTLGNRQFQQLSGCGFTADLASDQGTFQVQGMLAEYMNPTSGMGAFIVFFAQHQAAYEAARQDVVAMLASMLV